MTSNLCKHNPHFTFIKTKKCKNRSVQDLYASFLLILKKSLLFYKVLTNKIIAHFKNKRKNVVLNAVICLSYIFYPSRIYFTLQPARSIFLLDQTNMYIFISPCVSSLLFHNNQYISTWPRSALFLNKRRALSAITRKHLLLCFPPSPKRINSARNDVSARRLINNFG